LAYNGRPTEITGFLGNNQIEFLDEMVEKRQKNFFEINEVIMQNEDFYSLNLKHMDKVSNFAFPVVLKTKELWEKYKQKFEEAQVEIRPIIAGDMTKQPFDRWVSYSASYGR
jgi:CDP-6-deoxy-D-xylo-4-hexulose-3-dehydrase